MSYDWQSLRRSSLLGPKSGLSLTQSQQILRMPEMKQKSRRVSLIADSVCSGNRGLTLECTPQTQPSVETLSRSQQLHSNPSPLDSNCETTRKISKPLIGLSDDQNQCNTTNGSIGSNSGFSTQSVVINNNSNSGLNSATTSAAPMLPIISYDSIVMSRPDMSGRMSRRPSKSAQESFTCSQQSILSAMDRFVKAVNNMDSTVLVPSKLRDMDTTGTKVVRIPPSLANTDLHSFYLMLNDVKKELLWGPGTAHSQTQNLMPFSGRSTPRDLKHIRQPSNDSLGSLGSTASSSSDQDTDSEADSLMTDRDSIDEHTSHLAAAFRHHLQGLHTILHQLADSADYLSSRYQEDIDASSL